MEEVSEYKIMLSAIGLRHLAPRNPLRKHKNTIDDEEKDWFSNFNVINVTKRTLWHNHLSFKKI